MRLLILGTSNSILTHGWVAGLRAALPTAQIDNHSVGASPGIQFALNLKQDFTAYDAVFLDSIPNDEEFRQVPDFSGRLGYSSEAFVSRALFEIASTIAAQTCLVFVGICHKINLATPSSVYAGRIRLARALGVQFLDFRELLLAYGQRLIGEGKDLYETHPAHPQSALSYEFGRQIGGVLADNMRAGIFPPGPSRIAQNYLENFPCWLASAHQDQANVRLIKNSFVGEYFQTLHEGDVLAVDLPGRCIGFSINASGSSCVVRLEGAEACIDISCYHALAPQGLMKMFVPIPHGFALRRLRVVADSDAVAMKGLISTAAPTEGAPVQLELCGIAFWRGDENTPWDQALVDEAEVMTFTQEVGRRLRVAVLPWTGKGLRECLSEAVRAAPKGGEIAIVTAHDTVLCYDFDADLLRHLPAAELRRAAMIVPVKLRVTGSMVVLFADAAGVELSLAVDPLSGHLRAFATGAGAGKAGGLVALPHPVAGFSLSRDMVFIAAEPGGGVACNRQAPNAWEAFSLRPR